MRHKKKKVPPFVRYVLTVAIQKKKEKRGNNNNKKIGFALTVTEFLFINRKSRKNRDGKIEKKKIPGWTQGKKTSLE